MEDKKYCYRYVDSNDSSGRPIVMLFKQVVLRETEKTFWYCHDFPAMTVEQIKHMYSGSCKKNIKRCLKGAARSRYHLTREEALKAFMYRKMFQLDRLRLTAETVALCVKGLKEAGFFKLSETGGVNRWSEVLSAPEETFLAQDEPGEVASEFTWGEY